MAAYVAWACGAARAGRLPPLRGGAARARPRRARWAVRACEGSGGGGSGGGEARASGRRVGGSLFGEARTDEAEARRAATDAAYLEQQRQLTPSQPAKEATGVPMRSRARKRRPKRALERVPSGTPVTLVQQGGELLLEIPSKGLAGASGIFGFAVVWNAFTAFWAVSALAAAGPLFAAFSVPFFGAGYSMARQAFKEVAEKTTLTLSPSEWALKSEALGKVMGARAGDADDVDGCRIVVTGSVNGVPTTQLELVLEGDEPIPLGPGLSKAEQEWVRDSINEYLAAVDEGDAALLAEEAGSELER